MSIFSKSAVICACILTCAWATAATAEKRVALVIGNSAYENVGRLPNPANDAAALTDLLERGSFQVFGRRNLGNLEFRRTIREFTLAARDADVAVVFYAGHGIEVRGTNYLIPTDAKLVSDLDARDEAISLDRILDAIEPAKRLRLVILDACRDNPFDKKMTRTVSTRAVSRGLTEVSANGNMLVAYAARAGSTADDGGGQNSPFTSALLKHIAVPGLDVRLALGRVRDEVLEATGSRQEPYLYGSLGGSEVAIIPAVAKATDERLNVMTDDIRRDYEFASSLGSKEAWESFLGQYSTGFYANLARAQLSKLEIPKVTPASTVRIETITTVPVKSPPTMPLVKKGLESPKPLKVQKASLPMKEASPKRAKSLATLETAAPLRSKTRIAGERVKPAFNSATIEPRRSISRPRINTSIAQFTPRHSRNGFGSGGAGGAGGSVILGQ